MRKIATPIFMFISTWGFGQSDFLRVSASTDSTYGYTDQNPLRMKHGNLGKSIGYSYDFLLGLKTTDDQTLKFVQRITVDNPKYKKPKYQSVNGGSGAPVNGSQLDKYTFLTSRKKDTVIIYVDVFHRGELKIPIGLKYEQEQ